LRPRCPRRVFPQSPITPPSVGRVMFTALCRPFGACDRRHRDRQGPYDRLPPRRQLRAQHKATYWSAAGYDWANCKSKFVIKRGVVRSSPGVLAHARSIDVGVAATINAAPPAGVVGVGGIAGAREALHSSLTFMDLDVTNDNSVSNGVQRVIERYGRIDVLVNNAGMGSAGAAEETSLAEDQRVFDFNVFGVTRMTKAVLPHMRAQGAGRIINISSILGFIPQPYVAAYSASKHAVEWYSESVDHEVRDHGIRVLLVEPAVTKTNFDNARFELEPAKPKLRPVR
jgi:NAD(P)-dependent dehydrogenase (short-subunit alcohol dehydrogenase family)